jgi:hypothetical protein
MRQKAELDSSAAPFKLSLLLDRIRGFVARRAESISA